MKNIKDKKTFDKVCNDWYNRTISLREYSENNKNPLSKRHQARNLFNIMTKIILNVTQEIIKMRQVNSPKFEKGGEVPYVKSEHPNDNFVSFERF